MVEECPSIFTDIIQPPKKLKEAWRKMIPEWAWNAMVDDAYDVMRKEIPKGSSAEDIERRIRNKHVFIRREAFFPDSFLTDVVKEACKKGKR